MFAIDDYDFDLPPGLIAQLPSAKRDESRLLVLDRKEGSLHDRHFHDLPGLLSPGDLMVVNDTRVVRARLMGSKASGGRIELLVLEHPEDGAAEMPSRACLMKSSKPAQKGGLVLLDAGVTGLIEEIMGNGIVKIRFSSSRGLDRLMDENGSVPLPPYIKRADCELHTTLDVERYQTVYAQHRGAVAAPTAGLHFTRELIGRLAERGISMAAVTLHVGYGTFQPVRTQDIRDHRLGPECYRISSGTAQAIAETKRCGGKVVAVGTTVVRTLESAATDEGFVLPGEDRTGLLITPGFSFKIVDALVTNFHLPRSSLLFLVSAFAGNDFVREAYRKAIQGGYRFYSYGDAMLIL